MIARSLKAFLAVAAASFAAPSLAHEVSCENRVGVVVPFAGGSFAFSGEPTPTASVDHYPALVGFQIRVTNLAPEPSVLTGAWDSLGDVAGATVVGPTLAGASIPVGGSIMETVVVPVPSYEACLALGGEPAHPACNASALENRFVATHDAGSAECRARLVCVAPGSAPVCAAPDWTGPITIHFDDVQYEHTVVAACDGSVLMGGEAFDAGAPGFHGTLTTIDRENTLRSASSVSVGGAPFTSVDVVRIDGAGRTILAGRSSDFTTISAFVRVLAPGGGTLLWERTFPYDQVGWNVGMDVDAALNVYLAFPSAGHPSLDARVVKLSPAGDELWSSYVATPQEERPSSLAVTPAGDVFVAGTTAGAFPGFTFAGDTADAFVARLDTDGNLVWVQEFGTEGWDITGWIAVDAAGRSVVAGSTVPPPSAPTPARGDAFVASFSPTGEREWITRFGGPSITEASGVALAEDGSAWVAGSSDAPLPGATFTGTSPSGFVLRLDRAGSQMWARQFGDVSSTCRLEAIAIDAAGWGVAAGEVGVGTNGEDGFVVRVAPDGSN